jgi:hypothetical protein
MEESSKLHAAASWPPGNNPSTHWTGGWVGGPHNRSGGLGEKSLAPVGIRTPYHIYIYLCACLCAEHRGNVRNLALLNWTSRLLRTQPHAAATYRQIPEALPAANSGGEESSYKRVHCGWGIWRFCTISYQFLGAYYILFWTTVIQDWVRYKCTILQRFACLMKLKL